VTRPESASETETQVTLLFEDVLARLPPGCARLGRRKTDNYVHELALVPASDRSAEFGVIFMDGKLYAAFFGCERQSTTYESPWEIGLRRRDGLDKQLAIIERMCLAVVAGRCEHRYRRVGIEGVIHVSDNEVYRVTDVGLLRILFPRHASEVVLYAPCFPGAENLSRSFSKVSI
jgi:hypothetical protein